MPTQMLSIIVKALSKPDEVREFDNGKVEIVRLGDTYFARLTLMPGWKWSRDVKPVVKTDSCQMSHTQYVISGRLSVLMDDGTKLELKAGDVAYIPPGHEAWVAGNEPFVAVDWTAAKEYAKPR